MKNILILIIGCFLLVCCNSKTYYGYVYDKKIKKPLEKVQINDFLNERNAETDAKGYFKLNHEGRIYFNEQKFLNEFKLLKKGEKMVLKLKIKEDNRNVEVFLNHKKVAPDSSKIYKSKVIFKESHDSF